jgi:hypothetical protein
MIVLDCTETQNPDFGGFRFFVEFDRAFFAREYAEAYGLNYYEIDPDSVKMCQDAASRLNPGFWLEITHG